MKDYNPEVQKLFLEMMLEDAETYVRVQNIYNAENFDRSLREAARFIKKHSDDHKTLPTREQIQAATGVELRTVPDLREGHYDWFLSEFEGFSRKQELERAIQIKSNNGQVSTGWPTMDQRLFGGMNRGELNIFAGGSGSGKSLFMQNIAINWITAGLNGVFLTLELSEELCAMRMDAMVANCSTKEIFKDLDTLEMKIRMVGKKSGKLRIKYMPAQSNVNHIRAYLKELEIQTGQKTDFIMVDYLDLVMPVSAKVSPSDLFVKDKYVSEELRNLAREFNILMITASQLNRSAVEEIEFDHSHISGGISKINTADNVFGIFTSRAMRERGRYQIQLMKTRSSSGVGQKVDLEFNIESLRITDPGEDAQSENGGQGFRTSSQIMDQIKTTATTSSPMIAAKPKPGYDIEKSVQATVDSTKLKQMLASLKTKTE